MTQVKWLLALLTSLLLISTPAAADDDWDDDDHRPKKSQSYKKPKKAQKSRQRARSNASYISSQRAAQIARGRVKGGRVVDVDRDGGVYEVDVVSGRAKYEVKINARTGKVIRIKRDD